MVPRRLKDAREAAGLTQEGLAELLDIEGINVRSRLSNYEVGRFSPPFDFVVRVAKLLDYPESYFYTIDDDFAKTILEIHQNRNNPNINPYYNYLIEAKRLAQQLNDCLKKMVD